ncbi:MAG: HAMP domain-containing histidine kinase [Solirubrobacteraceae bacterium MAG38_C4-C5]|nr:HAMP domain-containing histidine kinase [Candidatus Siliceabacter maunaloa]
MSLLVQSAGWAVAAPAMVAAVAQGVVARRRRVLVARTCHEVRGPLTALGLAVTGMGRRGEAPMPCLTALDAELTRATAAIEDLVCAGRGRRTVDRPEAVELGALLRAAVAAWTAGGHAVRLEPVPETWLLADRVRLARAVANLVANAVEHGGGAVIVRVRSGAGRLAIEVMDEGRGLPAPVATLIARRDRSVAPGSGARLAQVGRIPRDPAAPRGHGLAVAAETARRHGGRLVARPTDRGARLALELPAPSLPVGEPA